MAKIEVRMFLDLEVTLKLNEREAMALDALAGYGTDAFLKCFYRNMGESYLKPYEKGLVSLFAKIRAMPVQHEIGDARRAITEHRRKREEANRKNIADLKKAAQPRRGEEPHA